MALVGFLEVRRNKNLFIMIVSLIVAISMFSWYGITNRMTEIQHNELEESKLNQILAYANTSAMTQSILPFLNGTIQPNITVVQNPANVTIVVPTDDVGKIGSSLVLNDSL